MKYAKTVSSLFLAAGLIALAAAVVMALTDRFILASPGGWLEFALVMAVFSIAAAIVPCGEKPK